MPFVQVLSSQDHDLIICSAALLRGFCSNVVPLGTPWRRYIAVGTVRDEEGGWKMRELWEASNLHAAGWNGIQLAHHDDSEPAHELHHLGLRFRCGKARGLHVSSPSVRLAEGKKAWRASLRSLAVRFRVSSI